MTERKGNRYPISQHPSPFRVHGESFFRNILTGVHPDGFSSFPKPLQFPEDFFSRTLRRMFRILEQQRAYAEAHPEEYVIRRGSKVFAGGTVAFEIIIPRNMFTSEAPSQEHRLPSSDPTKIADEDIFIPQSPVETA